jgi:hypothetical protein
VCRIDETRHATEEQRQVATHRQSVGTLTGQEGGDVIYRCGGSEKCDGEALLSEHFGEHLGRQRVPVAFRAGHDDQPGRCARLDRIGDRVECLLGNPADKVFLGDGPLVRQPALTYFALGLCKQVDNDLVAGNAIVDEIERQADSCPPVTVDGLLEVRFDRVAAGVGSHRAMTL